MLWQKNDELLPFQTFVCCEITVALLINVEALSASWRQGFAAWTISRRGYHCISAEGHRCTVRMTGHKAVRQRPSERPARFVPPTWLFVTLAASLFTVLCCKYSIFWFWSCLVRYLLFSLVLFFLLLPGFSHVTVRLVSNEQSCWFRVFLSRANARLAFSASAWQT